MRERYVTRTRDTAEDAGLCSFRSRLGFLVMIYVVSLTYINRSKVKRPVSNFQQRNSPCSVARIVAARCMNV